MPREGLMWLLLALTVLADSSRGISVVLAHAESLQVSVAGSELAAPVVLIPGLFGSAFAYRHEVPGLTAAGYRAIVIEPLGVGVSGRPEHADYSLTAQADRIAAVLDQLGVTDAVVVAHCDQRVDRVSDRVPSRRSRARGRLARRRPGRDGDDARPAPGHAAGAVDQVVRRRTARPQEDPPEPDRRVGRHVLGERCGCGRIHQRRRPRPGRHAQGLARDGGRAGARAAAA